MKTIELLGRALAGDAMVLWSRRLTWLVVAAAFAFLLASYGSLSAATSTPSLAVASVGPDGKSLEVPSDDARARAVLQSLRYLAWPDGPVLALSAAAGTRIGGALLVLLVAGFVAQHYPWRTHSLALLAGLPRSTLFAARCIHLLPLLLVVAALPLVAVGILSLLVTRSLGGELALGAMDFPQLGLAFLRTAFALLPDAALTLLLAVATRSPLATVGCGIGILLLGGNVVSGVLSQNPGFAAVGRYLPSQLSESLLSMNATAMKASIGPPLVAPPWLVDGGWAAALLAAYASVFVTLAWLIFRRQDLHP